MGSKPRPQARLSSWRANSTVASAVATIFFTQEAVVSSLLTKLSRSIDEEDLLTTSQSR